ncbi:MAG: hypothetical protein KAG28_06475 [Cocleimonas sp.]|nr:hypothetical protein [Cocleimonas sp.]
MFKLIKRTCILSAVLLPFMSIATADIDPCLVGQWTPDSGQLKQQFEGSGKQKINRITGRLTMQLNPQGEGQYQLNRLSFSMHQTAGVSATINMTGESYFSWSTNNQTFSMKSGKFNIKVAGVMKMGGMTLPLPKMPFNDSQWSKGFADGSYTCSKTKLVFKPTKKGKMLKVWHKI